MSVGPQKDLPLVEHCVYIAADFARAAEADAVATRYAYASNKRIILVGPVEHAFHRLDGIELVADPDAAITLMRRDPDDLFGNSVL